MIKKLLVLNLFLLLLVLTLAAAPEFQAGVGFRGWVSCLTVDDSSSCVYAAGRKLDLDADEDTSITADTDDQIDYELGGADVFTMKDWGSGVVQTTTTEHLFEILDTTNVMTGGTNVLSALNIDLGIGNSTGGTNSVYGILIDNISQDAQNTETAIDIAGTGWDVGIGLGGNQLDFDADDDTSITADTDDQLDIEVGGNDILRVSVLAPVLVEGSVFEVINGLPITPTRSYQPITSTAVLTTSASSAIADGNTVGELLCLVNENASDAINIKDAANTNLSGDAILGNDDVLCVLWDGADWLEISQVDN